MSKFGSETGAELIGPNEIISLHMYLIVIKFSKYAFRYEINHHWEIDLNISPKPEILSIVAFVATTSITDIGKISLNKHITLGNFLK